MNTIRLLFPVMSCLLLLRATCVVAVAHPAERDKSAVSPISKSAKLRSSQASAGLETRDTAGSPRRIRPVANLETRATKSAANPKRKSVSVDLRQNNAVNHRTFPVRPLNTVPFTKPPPKNLRNQTPAIIGGPANKHASAINGTGMKRKP